mmetsp:Transcript_784/g.770  ORF Transcript_784/g.770 Transcript_784/m.770 type:complete len:100 (+) Transcript_784:131-430(+)
MGQNLSEKDALSKFQVVVGVHIIDFFDGDYKSNLGPRYRSSNSPYHRVAPAGSLRRSSLKAQRGRFRRDFYRELHRRWNGGIHTGSYEFFRESLPRFGK